MRRHVIEWSVLLLSLSMLRIIAPPVVFSLGGLDFSFAVFGVLAALAAIAPSLPVWNDIDFRPLQRAGALLSFGLLLLSLYSPTLGPLRATYVSILDLFVLLMSALALGAAALEEKEEALSVLTAAPLAAQLLIRKIRGARTAPADRRWHGAHS